MNRALFYLWLILVKRRTLQFLRGLWRPTTIVGAVAVAGLLGFFFYHRRESVIAQLVRTECLIGGALVMLGGSLFKGFLQRGLVFELADVEFLFTSPFTERQVVLYRLISSYCYAILQGLVFFLLFKTHLQHPMVTASCLTLFQIVCFHTATGAAIYAGTISELAHHRIRWMLVGVLFVLTAVYLKEAWDLKLVPAFLRTNSAKILFYPAFAWSDFGNFSGLGEWLEKRTAFRAFSRYELWESATYLAAFIFAAAISLWLMLKVKANIFETSLSLSIGVAKKREKIEQGRHLDEPSEASARSRTLTKFRVFRGVGAIVWKNLVVATRSRKELLIGFVVMLGYTGFLIALRWLFRSNIALGGGLPEQEVRNFDMALCGMLAFAAFLLQRAFPFDFRRDGQHLVTLRTLPISAFGLALAELAVPTGLCLAFQFVGLVVLVMFGHLSLLTKVFMLLAYPAVALALNAVWNLHYVLAAAKRLAGRTESTGPVAVLVVVALSFLVFYPAGWGAIQIGQHLHLWNSEVFAIGMWLVLQYTVNILLILLIAKLFYRFEVPHDRT
jgi:hypothetical protein